MHDTIQNAEGHALLHEQVPLIVAVDNYLCNMCCELLPLIAKGDTPSTILMLIIMEQINRITPIWLI